jgi:peptidoglycan/LPS O-acetylase OafA/YrhL
MPPPPGHRPDIDGLRALAILPILLLHCGIHKIRGGFVGVDIFFVLSGYLITAILWRDLQDGRFSLLTFYRRRIVRILPALVVMMLVVLALGCLLFLPNQIRDLGWSASATSLFASNIYFYLTSDYFAQASDAKPFIHTWSLAVEEQFYIFYPLLLFACRRLSRPQAARIIAALAGVSLLAGAALAFMAPSAGFFLLPARIWELSLGALVALGAAPAVANARVRTLLCVGALAVVAASCVLIRGDWPFPVPFAIPVAVAAATLLAYGESGPTARLLGFPLLRWIGLISYSVYLWHRPILSFYQNETGTHLTFVESGILILMSLAAGTLSYRLVERPALRRWRAGVGHGPHFAAMIGLGLLALAGAIIALRADQIRPLPPALARTAAYLGYDSTLAGRAQFGTDRCFTLPTGHPFDPACLAIRPDRPNILLAGDSHAAHFAQALRQALPQAHMMQATAAGCRPLVEGTGIARCRAVMERAFHDIDAGRIDGVILSALWLDFEEPLLADTLRALKARNIPVVLIGPSPEYDVDLPTLMVRGASRNDPALPARFRLPDPFARDRRMRRLADRYGATYFSVLDAECPLGRCILATPDGTPMHFDHSHYTPAGARLIIHALRATGALAFPNARHGRH